MNIGTEIENVAQTVWADITTLAGKFWAFTQTFFSTLVKDEVTALQPFAKQAVSEIEGDLPILLTENLSTFAAAIAPVLLATASQAGAAGVQAGYQALMTAVAAAVANAQAALAAQPTPTPTVPPATPPVTDSTAPVATAATDTTLAAPVEGTNLTTAPVA